VELHDPPETLTAWQEGYNTFSMNTARRRPSNQEKSHAADFAV
jgi:hypothetical protein